MLRAKNRTVFLYLVLPAGQTLSAKGGEGKCVAKVSWTERIAMPGKNRTGRRTTEQRRSEAEARAEMRESSAQEGLEHLVDEAPGGEALEGDPFKRLLKGYREMTARTPTNAEAHLQYGRQFLQVSLYDWAIRAFKRALKLAPRWADAQFYYASALFNAGRMDEAAVEYEKALKLDPKMIEARFERELLILKKKRKNARG